MNVKIADDHQRLLVSVFVEIVEKRRADGLQAPSINNDDSFEIRSMDIAANDLKRIQVERMNKSYVERTVIKQAVATVVLRQ
jgi:hypothetical protein